jgi:bifunctional ADP-heptose synthase (sugar kinase/adenylyltransferase)
MPLNVALFHFMSEEAHLVYLQAFDEIKEAIGEATNEGNSVAIVGSILSGFTYIFEELKGKIIQPENLFLIEDDSFGTESQQKLKTALENMVSKNGQVTVLLSPEYYLAYTGGNIPEPFKKEMDKAFGKKIRVIPQRIGKEDARRILEELLLGEPSEKLGFLMENPASAQVLKDKWVDYSKREVKGLLIAKYETHLPALIESEIKESIKNWEKTCAQERDAGKFIKAETDRIDKKKNEFKLTLNLSGVTEAFFGNEGSKTAQLIKDSLGIFASGAVTLASPVFAGLIIPSIFLDIRKRWKEKDKSKVTLGEFEEVIRFWQEFTSEDKKLLCYEIDRQQKLLPGTSFTDLSQFMSKMDSEKIKDLTAELEKKLSEQKSEIYSEIERLESRWGDKFAELEMGVENIATNIQSLRKEHREEAEAARIRDEQTHAYLKVIVEQKKKKESFSLRHQIADEKLKFELDSIWYAVKEFQENQPIETRQGMAHCLQVEQNIDRLLTGCVKLDKFEDLEIFYLSAAAAVHDIVEGADAGKKLSDNKTFLRIPPEHLSTLQKIVEFQSTKNIKVLNQNNGFQQIYRLAVIFLLADTLDTKSLRIYSWKISDNNEICINATPHEETEVSCIDNYIKDSNVDLYSSYPYLKKYNLPLKIVRNNKEMIESDPKKPTEETKAKTVAEIEHQIKDLAETTEPIGIEDVEITTNLSTIVKVLESSQPTIMVVGDVMLDHLMTGLTTFFLQSNQQNVEEDYSLCVTNNCKPDEEKRLGGAANIAYCCSKLSKVILLGVVGKDSEGIALRDIAEKANIMCYLPQLEHFITTTKIYLHCKEDGSKKPRKIIRINRELDEENGTNVVNTKLKELGNTFRSLFNDNINCLILKDHQKGFLSKEFLGEISHDVNARLHNDENFLLIVDPKYDWEKFKVFDKIHAIIPNVKEAAAGIFPPGVSGKEEREKAMKIRVRNSRLQPGDLNYLSQTYQNIDCFVIKEDKNGALLLKKNKGKELFTSSVYYDPAYRKVDEGKIGQIGCGDVFDTYFVHCLLETKQFPEQLNNKYNLFLHLANIAAGVKLNHPTSEKVSIEHICQELDTNEHRL